MIDFFVILFNCQPLLIVAIKLKAMFMINAFVIIKKLHLTLDATVETLYQLFLSQPFTSK